MSEAQAQNNRIEQLLLTLGKAYLERNQYAEAYEKLTQLLSRGISSPEILLNAAIAAIGTNNVSQEALELYEQAVEQNQRTSALKIGLATLFMNGNVVSEFAIKICEQAVELAPPNEPKIRLYLKKLYKTSGKRDKMVEQEQKVVFRSKNRKAIRAYLEKFWWAGQFREAVNALANAPSPNGTASDFNLEKALTFAYSQYAGKSTGDVPEQSASIRKALNKLDPASSMQTLRDYLTLRGVLHADQEHALPNQENIEEYQFILGNVPIEEILKSNTDPLEDTDSELGPFDFNREILLALTAPAAEGDKNQATIDTTVARCLTFTKIFTHGALRVPEKLINLVTSHLSREKSSLVRQSGSGFLCIARSPANHLKSMISLLNHLDEYNSKVERQDRISLISGTRIANLGSCRDDHEVLIELVKTVHLLRSAEMHADKDIGAGQLYLTGEEEAIKSVKNSKIALLARGKIPLLPGDEQPYHEVIWRNALGEIIPGEDYPLGRFNIRSCMLKHGTYATYQGFDEQLARAVLVKVMFLKESVKILEAQGQKERLLARIRNIGRLNHPNIANLYDMGIHKNMFYYVREHIDGQSITELKYDKNDSESENRILTMVLKIVRALSYAEKHKVAHLNLKPGNIWLNEANEIKLSDFRVDGFVEDGTNSSVLFPGHWRYMAPEVLLEGNGDHRSDIYSIGVIAYELLAGKHPYTTAGAINGPRDIQKVKIADLKQHSALSSPLWNEYIMKAIQGEPEARYQRLSELEADLRKLQMQLMQNSLDAA